MPAPTASIQPVSSIPSLTKGGVTAIPTKDTTQANLDAAKASGWSPTVLSDSNIRDTVIPDLTSKSSGLLATPTVPTKDTGAETKDTKGDSNAYGVNSSDLDYGDIFSKVFDTENNKPIDSDTQKNIDSLEAMKKSNDAAFATQVGIIKDQFETNQNLMIANQDSTARAASHMLLRSGSYRTSAAFAVPAALRTRQINELTNFQNKENLAIAKVKTAEQNSDFKTMQEEMKILDNVRTDKKNLATKISEDLLKENEKISKGKTQNAIDNAVAEAVGAGTTDLNEILSNVTDKGLPVTTADVERSMNTIAKANNMDLAGFSGNVKNFFALKEAGGLPKNIKSLPEDEQLKAFLDMEHSSSSKTASSTKPLYTTTKGAPVTKSDIESGVQKLDGTRSENGYADPKIYKAMYDHWEEEGLAPAEFIKQYPPKYYIDPADTSLPSYLRPASKSTAVTNPFAK